MLYYIFCILFFICFGIFESKNCEKNALPDSIEVTNNEDLILKCSKPKFSIIQKNRYQFYSNETWHFYALNYKICPFTFTSDKCNGKNGEWIAGINSVESKILNFTCCFNENLKSTNSLKHFYIEKGQKLNVGEIVKNGTLIGFAYISNINKIVNYDKSVTYKISVNKVFYQKTRLQMYGITMNNNENEKVPSKLVSLTDDKKDKAVLYSVEFGVCNKGNKNFTKKPCQILSPQFSSPMKKFNSYHWQTRFTKRHPFSRKLYQAPLRPGSSQFQPSKAPVQQQQNLIDDSDDYSIEFNAGGQCPLDSDTSDFDTDTDAGTEAEAGESTADSANAVSNANSNTNANGNSNGNPISESNTNSNSQTSSNQNSQTSSNQNSQTSSNQNSQTSSNQNSQANNNNQNSQTNTNQNFQSNLNQNSPIQAENGNSQIIQSQNPVNPLLMPNVPFVQNPVYPPATDYGFYGVAGGSQGACFSGDTKVLTINGKTKRMDELAVDDWIYSAEGERFGFSRIISWLHRMPKQKFKFLKITLENKKILKITRKHYIYKIDCAADKTVQNIPKEYIEAKNLQISDCLLHLNNKNQLQPIRIQQIENIFEEGIYAPLTDSGTIFVNNILASCYSEIDSHSLISCLPKLNKYFKIITDLFRMKSSSNHQHEIGLIPGIEMLIKALKSNLYPNYHQKN